MAYRARRRPTDTHRHVHHRSSSRQLGSARPEPNPALAVQAPAGTRRDGGADQLGVGAGTSTRETRTGMLKLSAAQSRVASQARQRLHTQPKMPGRPAELGVRQECESLCWTTVFTVTANLECVVAQEFWDRVRLRIRGCARAPAWPGRWLSPELRPGHTQAQNVDLPLWGLDPQSTSLPSCGGAWLSFLLTRLCSSLEWRKQLDYGKGLFSEHFPFTQPWLGWPQQ